MNESISQFLKVTMVVAALIYVSSYAFFRINKQIVHESATAADTYTYHHVCGGDAPLIGASINAEIALFYTPLCLIEQVAWYHLQPVGAPKYNWKAQ